MAEQGGSKNKLNSEVESNSRIQRAGVLWITNSTALLMLHKNNGLLEQEIYWK